MWTITTSIVLASIPLVTALGGKQCLSFENKNDNFVIADHGTLVPIITNSSDSASIHIAVSTFADDLERVTGSRPAICNGTVPDWASKVIMIGTGSNNGLEGKWEAYDIRVVGNPMDGVDEALMITGSDKVSLIHTVVIIGLMIARCDLRIIRIIRTNGSITLVLVGGRSCYSTRCYYLPERYSVRSRFPDRQVPRDLYQRRESSTIELVTRLL
jgi:hypothetical protein